MNAKHQLHTTSSVPICHNLIHHILYFVLLADVTSQYDDSPPHLLDLSHYALQAFRFERNIINSGIETVFSETEGNGTAGVLCTVISATRV